MNGLWKGAATNPRTWFIVTGIGPHAVLFRTKRFDDTHYCMLDEYMLVEGASVGFCVRCFQMDEL